ncbi:hypothetical protein EKD04_010475 [Chloroflexales bacterium ZM16-3]|nr:hypothetical protein [Chloroflexales bacterium ZM16-3]
MQPDYTDQDTERARQAERSSAGVQTQQLHLPEGLSYAPAGQISAAPAQRANPLALGMIVLGVLLLLARGATVPLELTGGMVLLTISSCFFFFGLWKHIYGLIIPACILAGLSVGVTFADLTDGVSVLWGLSLGFLGIFALGRGLFGMRTQWPIYPAVPLFAVGLIVAAANLPSILGLGMIWGPLLLIGAGLYLGWFRR